MRGRLVLLVLVAALTAACAEKTETTAGTIYQRTCDDGGAGGVVIDGVCL